MVRNPYVFGASSGIDRLWSYRTHQMLSKLGDGKLNLDKSGLMVLVVREILFPILDFISCFPSHAGVAPIWPFENRQFNWGRLWSFSCKVHWRRPETITRLSQTEDS